MLIEDDFLFTEKTNCAGFIPWLRDRQFDILGGAVFKMRAQMRQTFVGDIVVDKDAKEYSLRPVEFLPIAGGPIKVDLTMNFFGAHTRTLRQLGWDEDLKVCRHEDFFIRAKRMGLKVGYHPEIEVYHDHFKPSEYRPYRGGRIPQFWEIFKQKHDGYAFTY